MHGVIPPSGGLLALLFAAAVFLLMSTKASAFSLPPPYNTYVSTRVMNPRMVTTDIFGASTAISGNGKVAAVGRPQSRYEDTKAPVGSVFVYEKKGASWVNTQELKGSNAMTRATQGFAVAVSNDAKMIGFTAPGDDDYTGAAYIFQKSNNQWTQVGPKIRSPESAPGDIFGTDLAFSKNSRTLAVASFPHARAASIFVQVGNTNTWVQEGPSLSSGATQFPERRKIALSADGSRVFFTNVNYDPDLTLPRLIVYQRNSSNAWNHFDTYNSTYQTGIGIAVSDDGTKVVLTARQGPLPIYLLLQGSKYVFQQEIPNPNLVGLSTPAIQGLAAFSDFTRIIVGNCLVNGRPDGIAGAAWFFEFNGTLWNIVPGNLTATGYNVSSSSSILGFGLTASASNDGSELLFGGYGDNDFAGSVWFFGKSPSKCQPEPGLREAPCRRRIRSCNMKWTSRGCRINGRIQRDGGCQCQGYCGYQCKGVCNQDKECSWNSTLSVCTVRATGLPGGPITSCG